MIRPRSDVARLVEDLRGDDPIRRDAAVARLRVIGSRAVDALASLIHSGEPPDHRAAALAALDGIDDRRVVELTLPLTTDGNAALVAAAIAVLRPWVTREPGTRVLDALTSVALDTDRDPALRIAALDALGQLPRDVVAPLLDTASLRLDVPQASDDPLAVQEWLAANGGAPLSRLHAVIVNAREHERRDAALIRREQWQRARGAAHALLAGRGSKVALYDLRETFDAALTPLPLDYLSAVREIGDASCLEPMARAWAASPAETWWRDHLSEAATDIIHRTRLSGRSAVVKRIRVKWPGFL